jgi:site-specific recombinase XerD
MHADTFTLTAQKLLFNISQRDMQQHRPAVWTGKRHGRAGQVVQQGADLVVVQVLMGADSGVTGHHGQ